MSDLNRLNSNNSHRERETGVSEILGSVMIVGLVVILAAIASIIVFGIDVPFFKTETVYVDVSKMNGGGDEYLRLTHFCGDSVSLMGDGNCVIQLVSPSSTTIALKNKEAGSIEWTDGEDVFVYKTAAGYYISASSPSEALADFETGTWQVQVVDREEMVLVYQDQVNF